MKKIQLISCLFFLTLFVSCINQQKKVENQEVTKLKGNIFGTTYNIIYLSDVNYQKEIDSVFLKFNNSLSTYEPNSIISRVNRNDSSVVLDSYFIEAFDIAKKINLKTDGYFDPTIGKLINAYGFGSGKEKKNLTVEEIESLMAITGFDKVVLKDSKLYKSADVEFNVNAFAKGLGIDVVGRFLEAKQISNYLIEIGGEIRARGRKLNGKLWRVALDDPNSDGTRSSSKIIELDNQSMATSGNYRKFKVNNKGDKIVHTVNPKTGLAQENNLLSVSVISNGDCANVDAYATAFLAMGFEKTKAFLIEDSDLKVVLLYANKDSEIAVFKN